MAVPSSFPPSPCIERSKLILAGGLSTSAAILAIWLLIWVIFFRSGVRVLAFASGPTEATTPASLLFQDVDARATGGDAKPLFPPSDAKGLIEAVRNHLRLERSHGRPAVVYLASPAVGSFGPDGKGIGEAILPPPGIFAGVLRDPAVPGTSLKELVNAFKATRGKRLLILDIGRSAADDDVASSGDDPVAELVRMVGRPSEDRPAAELETWRRDWEGFAILCASGPGQWAGSSDADGQSVFGHFVAEALRREKADVQGLLLRVPPRVHRWVRDNRGAVQTPIVLGDASLSFSLPRASAPRDEEDPRQSSQAETLRGRLRDAYEVEATYSKAGVFLLDPLAWREYRQCWLRAERLLRAGRLKEADDLLTHADRHKAAFPKGEEDWRSLALALKVTIDDERRNGLNDKAKVLAKLIGDLRASPQAATATAVASLLAATPAKEESVEKLVEGQLIGWVKTYARAMAAPGRGLDAVVWLDGPRLADALALRGLAEEAASTFARHPWVERPLREADAHRREAGDLLFAPGNHSATIDEAHRKAEAGYRSAIEVADALRLAGQVASDLPALGAWHVRRRPADVDRLTSIAKSAVALDRLLGGGFNGQAEAPSDELRRRVAALKPAFEALVAEFAREAGNAKNSKEWRRIDDALAVPQLDPKLRNELVSASIDPERFPPIRPRPVAPKGEVRSAAKELVVESLINRNVSTHTLARGALDPTAGGDPAEADPGPVPVPARDPGFDPQRQGLARLDRALVLVGGGPEGVPGTSSQGVAAGDLVGPSRSARARRLRETPGAETDDEPRRVAFERARLALPASSSIRDGEDSASALPTRWDRMLLRLADRLREDGDRDLARAFFKEVKAQDPESEAVDRGIEALVGPVRVEVRPPVPSELLSRAWTDLTLSVVATGLPPGRAALRPGNPDRLDVEVPGGPVPLGGGASAASRVFRVRRPEANVREAGTARLVPLVFYRGRLGGEGAAVAFRLPPLKTEFAVRFSTQGIDDHRKAVGNRIGEAGAKKVKDQVVEHPRFCSIYSTAETTLEVALTYKPGLGPPRKGVRVTASLDGSPLTVAILPGGPRFDQGRTSTLALPIGAEPTLSLAIGPIHAGSRNDEDTATLRLEIRGEGDEPIQREEMTIQVIDPSRFYRAKAVRRQDGGMGGRALVLVTIERLLGDPIGVATSARAMVDQGAGPPLSIRHPGGRVTPVRQTDRRAEDDIAFLLHGESATFLFEVDASTEHTCQAYLTDGRWGNRWPLKVVEGARLAAPTPPAPAEPAPAPIPAPGQVGPRDGGVGGPGGRP